jgi:PBSX family phage portal protein
VTTSKAPVLDTAWIFDGPGGVRIEKAERPTTQLADDPFNYSANGAEGGLVAPPYDLNALSQMLETNALHARAVRQKGADILGRGIVLRGRELEGDAQSSAEEEDRFGTFVESIEDDDRGDGSFKERLEWAHQDYESVGWAVVEISRNNAGLIDGLWHVPGHTVRAHKDGRRFAQTKAGKLVWFKRFGLDGDVDRKLGGWSDRPIADPDVRGNELVVIRNYTPRSSYYGLPDHVPALAALAGWRAQAEFNVRFFDNHAVPSYAVIIEGATLTPELEELITSHFKELKGQPHKTLVLPVPGAHGDDASKPSVRFERLSVDVKDASFRMYKQDNALEICIAHGMPPYRIGWPIVGSLGGATAEEMTQIYNDAVVQPRQETWEQRLNRAILGKHGLDISTWLLKAAELDMRNEMRDIARAKDLYLLGVANPNDNARYFGFDQREDPGGNQYIPVPLAPGAFASAAPATGIPVLDEQIAKRWVEEVVELTDLRRRIESAIEPQLTPRLVAGGAS